MATPPTNGEAVQLRELVELLTQKLNTLERRLRAVQKSSIPYVSIQYAGTWPTFHSAEVGLPVRPLSRSATGKVSPLTPFPGNACLSLRGSSVKPIGLLGLGLEDSQLEAVVELFAHRQQTMRTFIPIFITDSNRFEIFRRHGFVFEYIPSIAAKRVGNRPNRETYVQARLELIKRKWGLTEVANLGPETLDAQPATSGIVPNLEPIAPAASQSVANEGEKPLSPVHHRKPPRRGSPRSLKGQTPRHRGKPKR
jgi:hypothetical protein